MKTAYTLSYLFFLLPLLLLGQRHDYTWLFSENYISNNDLGEASMINFNTIPPSITAPDSVKITFWNSTTTMSNADGDMIFFTNGCEIHDASFQLMENGHGINPGPVHDSVCYSPPRHTPGYTAGPQSCMAVPMPGSDRYYYLFHIAKEFIPDVLFPRNCIMYFTKIDMQGNGGLGAVVEKNTQIFSHPPNDIQIDNLTATKHANGQDWWIICPYRYVNGYHKILLTNAGVVSVTEQYIGQSRENGILSQITFSHDGTLFAHCTNDVGLQLYDFDRATGEFSNPRFYPIEPDFGVQAGVNFSPSGRFMYASNDFVLYQYDLWAADVGASRILIAEYDGYADPIPTHFYMLQLGPDCKLYMFCPSCTTIHVIREPDLPGLACEVVQNDVQLPWGMRGWAAPSYPNYRLGALGEPVISCGPLSGTAPPPPVEAGLHLYPNPAGIAVTVEWEGAPLSAGMITVRNSTGKEVLHAPAAFFSGRTELRINTLPPGWYSLYVQAGTERRVARLVVQR
jgi:hypothetical protein